MSALLDDIISAAIDGKQPLSDILRKCLLLGHELKNERLKSWANQELNGYASGPDVPDYRILNGEAKGNFVGPFGRQLRNWTIPSVGLEKKHRDFGERLYLCQGLSAFQDVPKEAEDGLSFPWPGNLVVYYQDRFFQGRYRLISAWQEISKNQIAEMLDNVRNRTLNMALQLKDELGTSYTDLRTIEAEKQTTIQNIIFQNTGGNTNVAFGASSIDASAQTQIVLNQGDRKALDEVLSRAGVDAAALQKLTEAIREDGGKSLGSKVREWIKENAGRVLSGGMKVGVSIGQQLLTEWLKQHYGIH